jgi:hypothetical protein
MGIEREKPRLRPVARRGREICRDGCEGLFGWEAEGRFSQDASTILFDRTDIIAF